MEERIFWLAWTQVSGIGPVLMKRLQQKFGTLAAAWKANSLDLQQVEGFGYQTINTVLQARSQFVPEDFYQQHQQQNPNFWTPADADYPRLLLEVPTLPPVLYYQGQVETQENHGLKSAIAIVGTRDPSDYGKRWTRKISTALAKKGFTIVSGMAGGIDTEAHQSCLEAGGRTIAVLGTGVDIIYPPRNRHLYAEIQKQGLVVSEYSQGTPPHRLNFPRRNRIIAGLSRAVLVIEAPHKSGALITAHQANDFCRDVYVLPGRIDDIKSEGCLGLLNKGAHVILSENHLLEMLGEIPPLDTAEQLELFSQNSIPNLAPELQQVMQIFSTTEVMTFDLIVQKLGLATGFVSSALLQLELMGLISQLPGMRYQKS